MAWTTSASVRVRPSFALAAAASVKQAKQLALGMHAAIQRGQPAIFLALAVLSYGVLTPFLPTSFTAAVLLLAGMVGAIYASSANLAGAILLSRHDATCHHRSEEPTVQPRTAHHTSTDASPPRLPSDAGRPRPTRPPAGQIANHDWAELMARINHELRTPLNAVIGFSDVMALEMYGPLGNDRYQDYVRHISESAGELLKSAEDTLALTALLTKPRQKQAPESCPLEQAIVDAWGFVERKAGMRSISLELAVPADIEVLSDARVLRQVLVNLLSEGIARTPSGGSVSLLAVTDGELIEIVLSVPEDLTRTARRAGSLAVCLARTLLEMQGSSLLEIETADGGWTAVTVLDRAVQPDFFGKGIVPVVYRRGANLNS